MRKTRGSFPRHPQGIGDAVLSCRGLQGRPSRADGLGGAPPWSCPVLRGLQWSLPRGALIAQMVGCRPEGQGSCPKRGAAP